MDAINNFIADDKHNSNIPNFVQSNSDKNGWNSFNELKKI